MRTYKSSAVRFDALMYGIELAYLAGKKYRKARTDLMKKVDAIAGVANIPEIMVQSELINKILHTDYLDNAGIVEFENIRESLRSLMKYIPKRVLRYDTNFEDDVLSVEWKESELENDDLKNYKAKAEFYIRQHQDNIAIAKLKHNKPLSQTDIESLEQILWSDLGTKDDYEAEYGSKPLGEFVREIVEYIVHNGLMKDLSVLPEAPFTDRGSVVEIFTDMNVWMGIRKVIDSINENAMVA